MKKSRTGKAESLSLSEDVVNDDSSRTEVYNFEQNSNEDSFLYPNVERSCLLDILRGFGIWAMLIVHTYSGADEYFSKNDATEMIGIVFGAISLFNSIFWFGSAFGAGLSIMKNLKKSGVETRDYIYTIVRAIAQIVANTIFTYGSIILMRFLWYSYDYDVTFVENARWYSYQLLRLIFSGNHMVVRDIMISTMLSSLILLGTLNFLSSRKHILMTLFGFVIFNFVAGILIRYLSALVILHKEEDFIYRVSLNNQSGRPYTNDHPFHYVMQDERFMPSNVADSGCVYLYADYSEVDLDKYCDLFDEDLRVDCIVEMQSLEDAYLKNSRYKEEHFRRPHSSDIYVSPIKYPWRICDASANRDHIDCETLLLDELYLESWSRGPTQLRLDSHVPWYGSYELPCSPIPNAVEFEKVNSWLVPSEPDNEVNYNYERLLYRNTAWQQIVVYFYARLIDEYGRYSYGIASNIGVLLAYYVANYGWDPFLLSSMLYGGIVLILIGIPGLVDYIKTEHIFPSEPCIVSFLFGILLILLSFLAYFVEYKPTGFLSAKRLKNNIVFRYFKRFGIISWTIYVMQYLIASPLLMAFQAMGGNKKGYCLKTTAATDLDFHSKSSTCDAGDPESNLHFWFFFLYLISYMILISSILWLWENIKFKYSLEWVLLRQIRTSKKKESLRFKSKDSTEKVGELREIKPYAKLHVLFTAMPLSVYNMMNKRRNNNNRPSQEYEISSHSL